LRRKNKNNTAYSAGVALFADGLRGLHHHFNNISPLDFSNGRWLTLTTSSTKVAWMSLWFVVDITDQSTVLRAWQSLLNGLNGEDSQKESMAPVIMTLFQRFRDRR
jgi:hypothetical protein